MLADGSSASPVSLSAPILSSSSPVCLGWRASGLSSVGCRSSGSCASRRLPLLAGLAVAGPELAGLTRVAGPLESSDCSGRARRRRCPWATSTVRRPAVRSWVLLTQRLGRYTDSGAALCSGLAGAGDRLAQGRAARRTPDPSRAPRAPCVVSIRTGIRNAWIHCVPAGVYGTPRAARAVRSIVAPRELHAVPAHLAGDVGQRDLTGRREVVDPRRAPAEDRRRPARRRRPRRARAGEAPRSRGAPAREWAWHRSAGAPAQAVLRTACT